MGTSQILSILLGRPSVTFLVIVSSPKTLDEATSNFTDACSHGVEGTE